MIGSKIKFIGDTISKYNDREYSYGINSFYTENDGIPSDYITHGRLDISGEPVGEIVNVYNQYFLIKYKTTNDKGYVVLGFKRHQFELLTHNWSKKFK